MANNWPTEKLGKFIKLQGGNAFKSSNYEATGVPLVRIGNVGFGQFVNDSFVYLSEKEYKNNPSFQLNDGDILVGMTGELGKVTKIFKKNLPALLNQRVGRIQFTDSRIDKEYVYQLLLSDYFISRMMPLFVGAAQKNISSSQVENIVIPFPPIQTQYKIGDILLSVDEVIQKTDQIIQKAEKLKLGLLNDLIGKYLDNKNNANWIISRLADVCDLITDGKHGDCQNEQDSGFYFISSKDVHNGLIDYSNARQITRKDFEEADKRTQLNLGDLVMTNSGTIGRMAIVTNTEKTRKTTFQKSVAIIKPKKKIVSSNYLFYYFLCILPSLQLTSNGSAQKNLLLKDMRSLQIPIPRILEQQRIVSILSGLDQKITSENNQKDKLLKLKNGLMQEIFNQRVQFN